MVSYQIRMYQSSNTLPALAPDTDNVARERVAAAAPGWCYGIPSSLLRRYDWYSKWLLIISGRRNRPQIAPAKVMIYARFRSEGIRRATNPHEM